MVVPQGTNSGPILFLLLVSNIDNAETDYVSDADNCFLLIMFMTSCVQNILLF